MKRHLILIVAILAGLAGLGFAGIQDRPPAQRHLGMGMVKSCPMKMPGVDTVFEDPANGISMTFTTQSDDVAVLRRRVERMAKMHTNMMMTPFTAKYEEVPNGVRLTLTPNDSGNLQALRNLV